MNINLSFMKDYLLISFKNVDFKNLMIELEGLLEQHFFDTVDYPKVLFCFESRNLSLDERICLYQLLIRKKRVLLLGIIENKTTQYIEIQEDRVRSGEHQIHHHPCLYLNNVHSGSEVIGYGDLYFLGDVSGVIRMMDMNSHIYGRSFHNALIIYGHQSYKTTSNSLVHVYYNNKIILNKEENICHELF